MPPAAIDWDEVGKALGVGERSGSSADALRAVAHILGDEEIRRAVDWYVEGRPYGELVRHVLWQLRPAVARDHLVEIARSDADLQRRRDAVELLRVVAGGADLPLVAEFLSDSDAVVQLWGVGVLDQVLWSELAEPEEAEEYLRLAERSSNPGVVEQAGFIRNYLRDRLER